MSHFATPEGEQEGGRKEARPPFGADSQFYTALGRITIAAVESALSDDPSPNLSFLDGSSVRASVTVEAGAPDVQPGSGACRT